MVHKNYIRGKRYFYVSGKKYGRQMYWEFKTLKEAMAQYHKVQFQRGWDTVGVSEGGTEGKWLVSDNR